MSYKVERWRGYEPWGVTNPFVFANYGQPQRHRGYVSPMVYQTQPPSLRNDHLGQADFVEEDRRRARRMEYVAFASLALSAWSMWFFYTKMSGPTRNGRARRNGRRARRPRRNSKKWSGPVEAAQIVDRIMLMDRAMPVELVRDFGVSVEQANALRDLAGPGFGPGGKGRAWVVRQAGKVLKRPRKNSHGGSADWVTGAHFPEFKTKAEAIAWAEKKIGDSQPWKVMSFVHWGGSHDKTLWKAYVQEGWIFRSQGR